jgi:hypothetical protein
MSMLILINEFLYVWMLLIYRFCYHHHDVFMRERSSETMIPGPPLAIRSHLHYYCFSFSYCNYKNTFAY